MLKIINHYRRHGKVYYVGSWDKKAHFFCECQTYLTMWHPFA